MKRPLCPCNACHAGRTYNAQQRRLTVILCAVLALSLVALYYTAR